MARIFTCFAVLMLCLFPMVYAALPAPGTYAVAYRIKPIGFRETDVAAPVPLVFAEYGRKAKVLYPPLRENLIRDPSAMMKKCHQALRLDIEAIMKAQAKNKDIARYLTLNHKTPLLSKGDWLSMVTNPQQKTFQRDPSLNKAVGEFSSKIFPVNERTAFCIYMTFICDYDTDNVQQIIISVVKLEKQTLKNSTSL